MLHIINWRLMGCPGDAPQPIERPGDRERRQEEIRRAKEARIKIETTQWKEVD